MRKLTDEQKKKFHIYKETEEYNFPEDRAWKLWIPNPEAMYKGSWLQLTSQQEAMDFAGNPEKLKKYLEAVYASEDGWW